MIRACIRKKKKNEFTLLHCKLFKSCMRSQTTKSFSFTTIASLNSYCSDGEKIQNGANIPEHLSVKKTVNCMKHPCAVHHLCLTTPFKRRHYSSYCREGETNPKTLGSLRAKRGLLRRPRTPLPSDLCDSQIRSLPSQYWIVAKLKLFKLSTSPQENHLCQNTFPLNKSTKLWQIRAHTE